MINLTNSSDRIRIDLKAASMGKDLCVILTGGDTPHLGAVALSSPRASLANPAKISSSTSVLTVLGHKEDDLAKKAAQFLSAELNTHVTVCCGIHQDNITHGEISTVSDIVDKLLLDLLTVLKSY